VARPHQVLLGVDVGKWAGQELDVRERDASRMAAQLGLSAGERQDAAEPYIRDAVQSEARSSEAPVFAEQRVQAAVAYLEPEVLSQ
jgi:hypothetical protein